MRTEVEKATLEEEARVAVLERHTYVIPIQTRANSVNRICLRPRRSNVSVCSSEDDKFPVRLSTGKNPLRFLPRYRNLHLYRLYSNRDEVILW